MNDRRVEVIYCDDIRNETGNKHSLMGVYHGNLVVNSFPAQFPKLCVWIYAMTPRNRPFENLRIRVIQGEEETLLFDSEAIDPPDDLPGEDTETQSVMGAIVFSPLHVTAETFLRVIVETGSEVLEGRRLRIKKNP
jgi:hypothetical protein